VTAPGGETALTRGSLVLTSASGDSRSIPFQFNPESVQRTLEPNTVGGRPGSRSQAVRYAGAPSETLTLACRLSAADGPDGDAGTPAVGIEARLAALALLAYPSTADVRTAQTMLDLGVIEVLPALADQLLFVWGQRVLPCRLVTCAIVEELYDADLRPVLATVNLTLRALSYSDVEAGSPAGVAFLAYQSALEQTAAPVYAPWTAPDGSGS
jgi:hypothetical protein